MIGVSDARPAYLSSPTSYSQFLFRCQVIHTSSFTPPILPAPLFSLHPPFNSLTANLHSIFPSTPLPLFKTEYQSPNLLLHIIDQHLSHPTTDDQRQLGLYKCIEKANSASTTPIILPLQVLTPSSHPLQPSSYLSHQPPSQVLTPSSHPLQPSS